VREELTERAGTPRSARTLLISETNWDSLPPQNEPPPGAAVVVVVVGGGATVVVVVGAGLVVVVVGAGLVVVVVGAGLVVVVGGAAVVEVVVDGATSVVVVEGAVEVVLVGTGTVVDGAAAGETSLKLESGTESVVGSASVAGWVVATLGLSAAWEADSGAEVNWLPTARAVPPMTNVATTMARIVAVRVLKSNPPEGLKRRIRHVERIS